jgi:selT/selW/selH-like putative selenoprotein
VEAEVKANDPGSVVKLIKGSGGVFDVTCNGKLIYSKQRTDGDRFPRAGEITRLIENERG